MKYISKAILLILTVLTLSCCSTNRDIKIASFNVRISVSNDFDGENCWINRRAKIVQMIKTESFDIFGTQESIYHQAKYLDDNLPEYTKCGVTKEGGAEKGEAESVAIFFNNNRFELVNNGNFWLSETPDELSKGWDSNYVREVVWIHLKEKSYPHKELLFMNTHFDHEGKMARKESGKLIISKISEIAPADLPIIITGDFNSTIEDEVLSPLRDNLSYARFEAPITDSIHTYNAWGVNERSEIIDHIFYKGMEPELYRTVTDDYQIPFLSDHYPIIFIGRI